MSDKPTPQEAAELLEQDRQERIQAVEAGIQELLRMHNCSMDIIMSLSTRRGVLGGEVVIVAGPPLPPSPPPEPSIGCPDCVPGTGHVCDVHKGQGEAEEE